MLYGNVHTAYYNKTTTEVMSSKGTGWMHDTLQIRDSSVSKRRITDV